MCVVLTCKQAKQVSYIVAAQCAGCLRASVVSRLNSTTTLLWDEQNNKNNPSNEIAPNHLVEPCDGEAKKTSTSYCAEAEGTFLRLGVRRGQATRLLGDSIGLTIAHEPLCSTGVNSLIHSVTIAGPCPNPATVHTEVTRCNRRV
jgi:hypothetical protein